MPASTQERNAQLWRCTLSDSLRPSIPLSASLRNVRSGDISALGLLFFAAFQGTIDDAAQTATQYTSKARAILDGHYGDWIAEASWTVEQSEGLQSACLVCDYKPYGCPVIAVVATAPASKASGRAGTLLDAALATLTALGHSECCAMVTKGNVASERLFESRGFSPHAAVDVLSGGACSGSASRSLDVDNQQSPNENTGGVKR
ncbi:hypothetical protein [Paraburkholderia sp. BL21I4N1]|uniref:hypothetical protein n=1 Tax=Paraburkholderia sp. BL21I4N1 TaxID=1938801 RepID=UPI000D418C65|nr:hypothetical protein [Paraburkholderia sp. BL21I4N1]PQV49371.1 hypothetical protein B0G83_107319 [Paraburkholderia sp. BL21I4N1]